MRRGRRFLMRCGASAVICAAMGCGDTDSPTTLEPPDDVELYPEVPNLRAALQDSGLGDYLGTVEPVDESPLEPGSAWTRQSFDPQSGVVCADGNPFFTTYRPGTRNDLVIVLDEGGACWNDLSCLVGTVQLEPEPPEDVGIFATDQGIETEDWHMVYAPYCDGSVFSGDNVVQFPRAGEFIFHGLRNLSAVLTVARDRVPNPERILVTGQSAGSYGAIFAIGATRLAFPDAELYLYADSGPGVTNPENTLQLEDFRNNWRFEERLPCASCAPQYVRFVGWMLRNDPDFIRAGAFSYTSDTIIRQFLGRLELISLEPLSPERFGGLMRTEFGQLEAAFPGRFEYFLAAGTEHIVSLYNDRFSDTVVDGVSAKTWFNRLIVGGIDWRSVDHAAP